MTPGIEPARPPLNGMQIDELFIALSRSGEPHRFGSHLVSTCFHPAEQIFVVATNDADASKDWICFVFGRQGEFIGESESRTLPSNDTIPKLEGAVSGQVPPHCRRLLNFWADSYTNAGIERVEAIVDGTGSSDGLRDIEVLPVGIFATLPQLYALSTGLIACARKFAVHPERDFIHIRGALDLATCVVEAILDREERAPDYRAIASVLSSVVDISERTADEVGGRDASYLRQVIKTRALRLMKGSLPVDEVSSDLRAVTLPRADVRATFRTVGAKELAAIYAESDSSNGGVGAGGSRNVIEMFRTAQGNRQGIYLIDWEGRRVPPGLFIGELLIDYPLPGQTPEVPVAKMEHGVVRDAGGTVIATYDRIVDGGGSFGISHRIVLYVLNPEQGALRHESIL